MLRGEISSSVIFVIVWMLKSFGYAHNQSSSALDIEKEETTTGDPHRTAAIKHLLELCTPS